MKHAKLRSPRPKLNNCLFAVYGKKIAFNIIIKKSGIKSSFILLVLYNTHHKLPFSPISKYC